MELNVIGSIPSIPSPVSYYSGLTFRLFSVQPAISMRSYCGGTMGLDVFKAINWPLQSQTEKSELFFLSVGLQLTD